MLSHRLVEWRAVEELLGWLFQAFAESLLPAEDGQAVKAFILTRFEFKRLLLAADVLVSCVLHVVTRNSLGGGCHH